MSSIKKDLYFYKKKHTDKVWWVNNKNPMPPGEFLFSFDKKKIYNLFADYPLKLTKEEKEIFDQENPFWKRYFRDKE